MPAHAAHAKIDVTRINAGRQRASRTHFKSRPMTRSGWTVLALKDLRALHHCFRGDLSETAAALGETRARCDQALNSMLGRTEVQALAVLEART